MVREQAEDDGLWFEAATAAEGYLQQELRKLHAAVESTPEPPVEGALDGCPCTIIEPCRRSCTCALGGMSGGCDRCARYGSEEQRRGQAERLAAIIAAASSGHDGLRIAAQLREAMLLTHAPHLERTGEGRVEGKCLEEPCVSMWVAARALSPAYG